MKKQRVRNIAASYLTGDMTARQKAMKNIAEYITKKGNNEIVENALTIGLKDEYPAVRISALNGLSLIKTDGAIESVINTALKDNDLFVRWNALKVLTDYKNVKCADVFIKVMRDRDWMIREQAVLGIASIEMIPSAPWMVPEMSIAILDPNDSVVFAALKNFKTKHERLYWAISRQLSVTSDKKYTMLVSILTALEGYRIENISYKRVLSLLTHQNSEVRILALRVLIKNKAFEKGE
jgi:HEAT repeat protein